LITSPSLLHDENNNTHPSVCTWPHPHLSLTNISPTPGPSSSAHVPPTSEHVSGPSFVIQHPHTTPSLESQQTAREQDEMESTVSFSSSTLEIIQQFEEISELNETIFTDASTVYFP